MVDWRRLPQPPAVPTDDLGSGETLDDDERAWLRRNPWLVRLRIASLVGLVVAVVIVSRMVYRRFQR
jgi:hypothetical protein